MTDQMANSDPTPLDKSGHPSNLKLRVASALVLIPVVLVADWLGGWVLDRKSVV